MIVSFFFKKQEAIFVFKVLFKVIMMDMDWLYMV